MLHWQHGNSAEDEALVEFFWNSENYVLFNAHIDIKMSSKYSVRKNLENLLIDIIQEILFLTEWAIASSPHRTSPTLEIPQMCKLLAMFQVLIRVTFMHISKILWFQRCGLKFDLENYT